MTASALDAIPGLGAARRKALLTHFGSVKKLAEATPEEIAAVPGIGPRTAEAIATALRGAVSPAASDVSPAGSDAGNDVSPAGSTAAPS
jgi:excinuclease ABC subunit C